MKIYRKKKFEFVAKIKFLLTCFYHITLVSYKIIFPLTKYCNNVGLTNYDKKIACPVPLIGWIKQYYSSKGNIIPIYYFTEY